MEMNETGRTYTHNMHGQHELQSNITVDWVALLLHVRKVYSSNLGLVTTDPNRRSSRFPQYLEGNAVMISHIIP
jgi:hypothetical protein